MEVVLDLQRLDFEQDVTRVRRALLDSQQDGPAHHQARQVGRRALGGRGGGHHLAPAHDRDLVGDPHHLGQLVGDEDDRLALGFEVADDLEEAIYLLRREHRRRLVEDEQPGPAIEGFQDLHALLEPHRQVADACARVDLQAVAVRELAHHLPGRGQVHHPAPRALVAEHNVLGHGQRRDEHEVLVHHPDPAPDGVLRPPDDHRLAVVDDLAGVRTLEPVDDVHQRRFASSVLAEQGVDLAPLDDEVHAVVGPQPSEGLDDPAKFEGRHGP